MKIETSSLIFIDIETVSSGKTFEDLPEEWKALWEKKFSKSLPDDTSIELYYQQRAALYAEFSRIVCISFGYYNGYRHEQTLRIKSLCGDNEKELLTDFRDIISGFEKHHKNWIFAGHNIKDFDLPFLSRRLIINSLMLPRSMDFYNLKPWEYHVVDTMNIWRFGDFRHFTSLELMAVSLGIPSPKSDIDGSQVAEIFWQKDFSRIVEYCQRDVLTVANIIRRLNNQPALTDSQIEFV